MSTTDYTDLTDYLKLLLSGEKHRRCERPQTGVYSACA